MSTEQVVLKTMPMEGWSPERVDAFEQEKEETRQNVEGSSRFMTESSTADIEFHMTIGKLYVEAAELILPAMEAELERRKG